MLASNTIESWIAAFQSALIADGRSERVASLLARETAKMHESNYGASVEKWPPGTTRPIFETRDESDIEEKQKP
jgi:hypothetical protein